MDVSGVDIVFIVILLFTTIRAGIRGFVRELMSMAAVILGITAAVVFSGIAAASLSRYVESEAWSQVIAFLGLFLVVYVMVKIFETALDRLVDRINLDSLDHALGFFLGLVEGLVVVFVLLLVLQIQPFIAPDRIITESVFAHFLLPLLPFAAEFLYERGGDV